MSDLQKLLTEFAAGRVALIERHEASARTVSNYDFNNTYQYVINREDAQLSWLRDAILDMGGTPEDVPEPMIDASGKHADMQAQVIGQDRDGAQQFVDKWRPRIEEMPNARHRSMLRVILGETLEHKRFFEQALAGRTDLLGRRADGAGTPGHVLPERWVGR